MTLQYQEYYSRLVKVCKQAAHPDGCVLLSFAPYNFNTVSSYRSAMTQAGWKLSEALTVSYNSAKIAYWYVGLISS